MTEFTPTRLEAIASWGQRECDSRVQVCADIPKQRAALASWRREKSAEVQIFADGSWRPTGTITAAQEAYCSDLLRQITRLLPELRLRIAGGEV